MLRILKWIAIGWLVLSILTFPFYWPFVRMIWVFMPNIPAAKYDPPATAIEARLQDIDYLSKLTEYDRAFGPEAEAAFSGKIEAMRAAAPDLTEAEFYLAVAEAVALADNGHTNVSYRPQYGDFKTIGARLYAFEDEVFVLSAEPSKASALGHKLLAIDGRPIADIRAQLQQYRGGNETWRTLYSSLLMESPELLAAAGLAESPEQIELTLEGADGEISQMLFEGLSLEDEEDLEWRSAWYSLIPEAGSPGFSGWEHVLEDPAAQAPRFLNDVWQPVSYELENGGLYIRALPGFKAGDQSIKNAYKAMLADHSEGSLDYLVVDFRLHDGGDYTKSMSFAKSAPKSVKADGDIYIITGPNTFSAAIVTVAMLKYYAGDRGMIIGEQMGDREQFWAERGSSFQLPNSGYYINYATGYHDWENGCKGEDYCYTMNEMYEVPAGSLAPEVELTQSFEAYLAGEDTVLNWIDDRH